MMNLQHRVQINSTAGRIWSADLTKNAGFTAADTFFRASCTALTATTSSAESTGTTVGASPPFGDVSAEWKKTAHPVRQET